MFCSYRALLSKDVVPDWQQAASNILVAVGNKHINDIMEEILSKFQPGVLPHFFVVQTLANLSDSNGETQKGGRNISISSEVTTTEWLTWTNSPATDREVTTLAGKHWDSVGRRTGTCLTCSETFPLFSVLLERTGSTDIKTRSKVPTPLRGYPAMEKKICYNMLNSIKHIIKDLS